MADIPASEGTSLPRVDGLDKVTGQARYTADIALPGLAHAAVAQSTIASGRLVAIDTSAAAAAPGVLAVITHHDAPRLSRPIIALEDTQERGGGGTQHLPLQDDIIHHWGQHVAVVVAESLEQAAHAASLVRAEYEAERPVLDMDGPDAAPFSPSKVWGSPPNTRKGDVAAGLAAAAVRVDATYVTVVQHHNSMELHATTAAWDGDALTIYEPSTWVYGVRKTVAGWFGLFEHQVRVVQHYVGGSFGHKGPTWPHVALAVMAARRVGRPVRLTLTRAQEFTSVGYRPRIRHVVRLGAARDGRLTAVAHDAVAQTAPFDTRVVAPVTATTRKLYACDNVETSYRLVHLNRNGPFTMRGPGESPGLFAVESAMDELAYALGMDPVELRLRNHADVDPETGRPWSSKRLRACYAEGAARFGWARRDPRPGSMRDGAARVGWLDDAGTEGDVLPAYAEALRRAGLDGMDAEAEAAPPGAATTQYTRYSFGAHFCAVRVAPATGAARVSRYVAAFDAGRVMNPRTARSQLEGGLVWGIGQALSEVTHYDPRLGNPVNDDLADYHVPVNADVPWLDAFFVDSDDPRELNPLGSKAVGEIATVGAAAAVANAVYHATGVRVRELPITPDRLL